MHPRSLAALPLALSPLVAVAAAAELRGAARVLDGETVEIAGQTVRLFGIDAPVALGRLIMDREVAFQERDRYGPVVAVCHAGGEDLKPAMVRTGRALAYTAFASDYAPEEVLARHAGVGLLWRGELTPPWAWRRQRRQAVVRSEPPGACVIKGNISRSGERIYDLPGQRFYDRTRISPEQGKRWFCSEAEAQAAGWPRSRR